MSAPSPSSTASPDLGRVARGGAINLASSVTYGASGFLLVAVVTGQLGASGTGELLLAIAVFNILVRICELGASTGCIRMISRDLATGREAEVPVVLSAATRPVVVVAAVAGAATWAGAEPLSRVIADVGSSGQVADHLRTLAWFMPVGAALSVLISASRGFGTMRVQALVDRFFKPLLQLVLVYLVLAAGRDGTAAVAWAVPIAVAAVPATLWIRSLLRGVLREDHRPVSRPTAEIVREFWRFSGPRAIGQLFAVAVLWLDTILIGALRSAEEAGIYAASTRYLLIGSFAMEAIMQVLGPNISRLLARHELARAQAVFSTATAWQVLLVWPTYLLVAMHAPTLLRVFGAEFDQATRALVVLSGGVLLAALFGAADTVVLMAGRSLLSTFNAGVILSVNIGLNLLLTPRWGIDGAAIAWAAAIVASGLLPALQLRGAAGIGPFGHQVWIAVAASTLAVGLPAALVRVALGPGWGSILAAAPLVAATAGATAWALRRPLALDELVGSFRRAR